jgi:hypothetical protein
LPPHGPIGSEARSYILKSMTMETNSPTEEPPDINAKTRIAMFRSVLASNDPDPKKSYDLVWLMHLVVFARQPFNQNSEQILDS